MHTSVRNNGNLAYNNRYSENKLFHFEYYPKINTTQMLLERLIRFV